MDARLVRFGGYRPCGADVKIDEDRRHDDVIATIAPGTDAAERKGKYDCRRGKSLFWALR